MIPSVPTQIFIVGMNGSGTTMLLECLSSHSLVFGFPVETKSLPYFIENQVKYGDLSDDQRFLKLWRDMMRSLPGRLARGSDRIPIPNDWQDEPRSAAAVFDRIMRQFAAARGKRIWCEKSPMYVHHLGLLANAFPDARFIHMIRDGRDCAASFHRRWKFNPLRTIVRWKKAVSSGKAQGQQLGSRYYEVRYERVTNAPEQQFRNICAFLGIPFEEAILKLARSRPEMTGTSAKSIAPNQRRASHYFDAARLAKMENIAGNCLTELGYVCEFATGDHDPSPWLLRWWETVDNLRRFAVVVLGEGRIFKPSSWLYVLRRVRNALKQRATLRS